MLDSLTFWLRKYKTCKVLLNFYQTLVMGGKTRRDIYLSIIDKRKCLAIIFCIQFKNLNFHTFQLNNFLVISFVFV